MITYLDITHMGKAFDYYIIVCEISFDNYEKEEIEVLMYKKDSIVLSLALMGMNNEVYISKKMKIDVKRYYYFLKELEEKILNHPKVRLRRLFYENL